MQARVEVRFGSARRSRPVEALQSGLLGQDRFGPRFAGCRGGFQMWVAIAGRGYGSQSRVVGTGPGQWSGSKPALATGAWAGLRPIGSRV